MHYTLDDLRRQFDHGTLARGEAYAREGRVRAARWVKSRLEGEVSGSGNSVYVQVIYLTAVGSTVRFSDDFQPRVQLFGQVGFELLRRAQQARKLWWTTSRSAIKGKKLRPILDGPGGPVSLPVCPSGSRRSGSFS